MPPLDPDILCFDKRRRGPKPLSVRAQFAATLWLDGTPVWQNGRVVWRHHDRVLEIGSRELDAASRALASLQRHPKTARRHCDNFDEWLSARLVAYKKATQLAAIRAPDLETLVSPSRRRNPAALERLVQLLCVESSVDALPASPAQALFEAWPLSQMGLQGLLRDESQPLSARALAALICGAAAPHEALPGHPLLRRAARYGARFGFPNQPALCIALLENNAPPIENSVHRIQSSLESRAPLCFGASQILALHRAGKDVSSIADWAEAIQNFPDPLPSLVFASVSAKRFDFQAQRATARRWNQSRIQFNASLCFELEKIARSGRPADLEIIVALLHHLVSSPIKALGPMKIRRNHLPNPREKEASRFQQGVEEVLGIIVGILKLVSDAPNPSALLQLVQEALPKFNVCPRAEKLTPREWASRWHDYIRSQQRRIEALIQLAQKVGVPLARRALELNCYREMARCNIEPELFSFALDLDASNPQGRRHFIGGIERYGEHWKGSSGAAASLQPIMQALGELEPALRIEWLNDLFDNTNNSKHGSKRGARHDLPAMVPFLPAMLRAAKMGGEKFPRYTLIDSALALRYIDPQRDPAKTLERFDWLAEEMGQRWSAAGEDEPSWGYIEDLVALAAQLTKDDENQFRQLMRVGWSYIGWDIDVEWNNVVRSAKLARQLPRLETALAANFVRCPARCLTLLEKLGPLDRYDSLRSPLQIWQHKDDATLNETWQVLPLDDSLQLWAIRFATAKRQLEEEQNPPASLLKIAAWPQKISSEIAALQQRSELTPPLAKRLENLVARLGRSDELHTSIVQEISEALQNITLEAELCAAERVVDNCYRIRLETLGAPKNIPLNADLLNAALFSTEIESNRKWLREIISAHCESRTDWRLGIEGNARWLHALSQRGTEPEQWLGESPQQFTIGSQRIELRLESNPLQILQMGNYFNTCLSRGGINAFSSVANAVELNKRVVFARDIKGRVVGRQLLAFSTENKLLGFYAYTSVDEELAPRLRDAFGQYARDFAARCHIELADKGEVERLFVANWYDDGTINWNSLDYVEPKPKKKKSKRRSNHEEKETNRNGSDR